MDLKKSDLIEALIQNLTERFGSGVFPIEDFRPDTPEGIGFSSSKDQHIYFSVVTTGQSPGRYSMMVEVPRTDQASFPFDLGVDHDNLTLEEVIEIFNYYR